MAKKTGWYPGDVKPVRVGWYERNYKNKYARAQPDWFDGQQWILGIGGKPAWRAGNQVKQWRGLAAPK